MELPPKEKAEELKKKVNEHTRYWDCYNDEPLEYDHTTKVTMLWVDEILSALENIPDIDVVGNVLLGQIDYWRKVRHYL